MSEFPTYPIYNIHETDAEREYRKGVREWVLKEVLPQADQIEYEQSFPRDLFKKMGTQGYIKIMFPKSIGGSDMGVKYGTIVGEEIAWACRPLVAAWDCTIFGSIPIMRFGNEELIKKYLPDVMNGDLVGAICMTEPGAGSDVIGSMVCLAEKDNTGDYIINGEKRFITNGSQADILTLWAITDPNVPGHQGMSAFVFEKDTEGFEVVDDFELMGNYGLKNTYMRFNNMRIPKENLLGKEGMGAHILLDELDSERTLAAAGSCGNARKALEIATYHANKRFQFRQPLRYFEAINFKLADMAMNLEAARLLTDQSARMIDAKKNASKISAMTKIYATETAFESAHLALQICGGLGYMKGKWDDATKTYRNPNGTRAYPVERIFRGTRLSSITAGTNEILRFLIQRELFREMNLKKPTESSDW